MAGPARAFATGQWRQPVPMHNSLFPALDGRDNSRNGSNYRRRQQQKTAEPFPEYAPSDLRDELDTTRKRRRYHALRRRLNPRAATAVPNNARDAGSGTPVAPGASPTCSMKLSAFRPVPQVHV